MAVFGRYDSLIGVKASATFAAKQYYVCKASGTAREVKPAASNTGVLIGIVQNDPAAGEVADVAINGIGKAAAETGISWGSPLTVSSTGRVKACNTNGQTVIGYALEASATAGDILGVMISQGFYHAT